MRLTQVCAHAEHGEQRTARLTDVRVSGAKTIQDADAASRAVANSALIIAAKQFFDRYGAAPLLVVLPRLVPPPRSKRLLASEDCRRGARLDRA